MTVQTDSLGDAAASIGGAIDRNSALAAGNGAPAPGNPQPAAPSQSTRDLSKLPGEYHKLPLKSFDLDSRGEFKFHPSGKPVMKNGRPKKARPGDELADGTRASQEVTAKRASPRPASSFVKVPDPTGAGGDDADGGAAPREPDPDGDALGEVVSDGSFNVVEGLTGEKATPAEREAGRKYAARAFGGMTIPPLLGLAVIILFFSIRVWALKARERKAANKQKGGDVPTDASADRGADLVRQEHTGQAAGNSAPAWWSRSPGV